MNDTVKAMGVVLGSALLAYAVVADGLLEKSHEDIEAAVAADLRDPSSAQFRNIKQGPSATCGEVNGKNALGAYVGFRPFVYVGGIVLLEPERPIASDAQTMTVYYKAAGTYATAERGCYEG